MTLPIVLLVASYLLGSLSFSYLIVQALRGIDVRTVGSGNAGATNVLRAAGRWPAVAALALDVGKGVGAVAGARSLGASPAMVGAAGVAVVLGHVFPVFLKFRGGKGVATAAGALGALALLPTLVALVVFAVAVARTRYVSLGSVTAALVIPLAIYVGGALGWGAPETTPWHTAAAVAIAVVVVVKHSGNLRRLRQGTESRLGDRTPREAPP